MGKENFWRHENDNDYRRVNVEKLALEGETRKSSRVKSKKSPICWWLGASVIRIGDRPAKAKLLHEYVVCLLRTPQYLKFSAVDR